jgi:sucrose-phosphate synthase
MSKNKKLTMGLLNPQGHVRWDDLQIAGHPDTGGQIVYIVELSRELAELECRVDIFTRYFRDPEWPGYDKEIEEYSDNLKIVRIKCGPTGKFLRKEDLWPVINEFSNGVRDFYKREGYAPDIFSSHYGDAGLSAAILKKSMKVPFTHTGHSLAGKKMDNLCLSQSNFTEVNSVYNFHLRVAAERVALRNSQAIICSTHEEVEKQYRHKVYRGTVDNADKFHVIPPGIDPQWFFPFQKDEKDPGVYAGAVDKLNEILKKHIAQQRLNLPCVFAAARFDAKKNLGGLLRAYAESEILQERANLLIVAGKIRDPLDPANADKFNKHEKKIIHDMLAIIEKYGIRGKVAVEAGFNYKTEMPYIYRYAARNKWIFINPALHEPFGLTVVEAMASGLPVVATKHGGPAEILQEEEYGLLVEPTDWHSIRGGLKRMFNPGTWEKYSFKGMERVIERYTWRAAARSRAQLCGEMIKRGLNTKKDFKIPPYFLNPFEETDEPLLVNLKKYYYIG